jgi:hypothetical protein
MDNNFKKIFSRMIVEDIQDQLYAFEYIDSWRRHMSWSSKEELIEIILKNATLLEFFIGEVFDGDGKWSSQWLHDTSYPLDRKQMCADLGIDFNSNIDELKKKILDEVNKNIDNIHIQNKINFISTLPFSTFYSYDLKNILDIHGMSSMGKKEELVKNVARNDLIVKRAMEECKRELQKDDAEKMCDFLSIDSEGNREELLQKINDYVFKSQL